MSGATAGFRSFLAYGVLQRKVLGRPYAGVMHAAIALGFAVLFLGSVLVQVDGYLLKPRGLSLLHGVSYRAFQTTLDAAGLLLLAGVGLALYRRLVLRPPHVEPSRQALAILLLLLCLAVTGFVLEGLRVALAPLAGDPWAFAGSGVAALLRGLGLAGDGAVVAYRVLWWSHALAAFALLAAVPYTRLAHLVLSPLNTLVAPPRPRGALSTPFNLMDLLASGRFDVTVGAERVTDFGWRERLALAACTNCGRCQEQCPAHATGTALSPRRVVQRLRLELERLRKGTARPLLEGAVSEDEVWSCTTCGACAQACPVLIQPPTYLVELRRSLVARNRIDKRKTDLLANLAATANPFGFPQADRDGFARELGAPLLRDRRDAEYLYWLGCAGVYDPRSREVAKAMVRVLTAAGVSFGLLGSEERCVGDPARRVGEEGRFQELAFQNIATLRAYGVRKVITHCPHCFNALRNEYPALGAELEVVHHSVLLDDLARSGRIPVRRRREARVTLHDSCYVGRYNDIYDAPRRLLRAIPGTELIEMPRTRERSFCCGAGGAGYWYEVPRQEKMSTVRAREARGTEAGLLAVECPYCLKMLEDANTVAGQAEAMPVRDIAEIVASAME